VTLRKSAPYRNSLTYLLTYRTEAKLTPKSSLSNLFISRQQKRPLCTLVAFWLSSNTSSSAIAERPRAKVGQFWPIVKDAILQTI